MPASPMLAHRNLFSNLHVFLWPALSCVCSGVGIAAAGWSAVPSMISILGPLGFLHLYYSCRSHSWKSLILWSLLACLSITGIAFAWVLPGLRNLSGMSLTTASLFFLIQSIAFNLKLPLAMLGTRLLRSYTRLSPYLILAALSCLGDLIFYQYLPWRWGDLGAAWDGLRQSAAVLGVYGLSLIIFLPAILIHIVIRFLFLRKRLHKRHIRREMRRKQKNRRPAPGMWNHFLKLRTMRTQMIQPMFAFLLIITLAGWVRLWQHPLDEMSALPPATPVHKQAIYQRERHAVADNFVNLALIQPATGLAFTYRKTDNRFASESLGRVFNQSLAALYQSQGSIDLLILPESSVPFFSSDPTHANYSTTFHAVVAALARYGNSDILYQQMQPANNIGKYYNIASIFHRTGEPGQKYTKQNLIPFGEYLPGEYKFPFLRNMFPEAGHYIITPLKSSGTLEYQYTPGRRANGLPRPAPEDAARTRNARLVLADWPTTDPQQKIQTGTLLPLICYEGLYPDAVRNAILKSQSTPNQSVDFLINLSNDSWFGDGNASNMHAAGVRLRALESGRYLIRTTLSGVTSAFDHLGRPIIERTIPGTADHRLLSIPRRPQAWTPYLSIGNWAIYSLLGLILVLALARRISGN